MIVAHQTGHTLHNTLAAMNTVARIFLIALLLTSTSVFAQVRTATIYLVPWDIETRLELTESHVREGASIRTEILDKRLAQSLLKWLSSYTPINPPSANRGTGPLRLVIDFTHEDGSVESFYGYRHVLFESRSGKERKIDEEFRSRFSSFIYLDRLTHHSRGTR